MGLVPEIDLLGLQVGGGGGQVPERVTSVLCAPRELEVGTFFSMPGDEAPLSSSRSPHHRRGAERLSLVLVAVNKHGRAASARGEGEGDGRGWAAGLSDVDGDLAMQCAQLLALRCAAFTTQVRAWVMEHDG